MEIEKEIKTMNIREAAEIFDDEVLKEIYGFRIKNKNELTIILLDGFYLEIKLVLKKDESFLEIHTRNLDIFSISEDMINLIFKIKTQWEDYISSESDYESSFDKQMEKKEIFEHLEKMCEVTE
jgi:hypothetical protein